MRCEDVVNKLLYPIDQPGDPRYCALIEQVKADLSTDGCAVIPGFLSQSGLDALLNEAKARADKAYYAPKKECNVYLGERNPDQPADHPQNIFLERSNGFVTADLYGPETVSRSFYYWPPLKEFLGQCLGKEELHIYEDPVSNMIVNLGKPQQQFNWHFDTNEFTITMLLQSAEQGGIFEYVPDLRTAEDECYDDVKSVLQGDRSRVKQLELNAGDMQLFLGRYSLHQVTPNTGSRNRLLLIMSFADQPGMVGSAYRVKDLYGKVTEVHNMRSRTDSLLD